MVTEFEESIVIFACFLSMNPLVQSSFGFEQQKLKAMTKPMSSWHIFWGRFVPFRTGSSLQWKVAEWKEELVGVVYTEIWAVGRAPWHTNQCKFYEFMVFASFWKLQKDECMLQILVIFECYSKATRFELLQEIHCLSLTCKLRQCSKRLFWHFDQK